MLGNKNDKPEGTKKPKANIRTSSRRRRGNGTKKGKVVFRGQHPARTFFTNHSAKACVDRSYDGRTVTRDRDAGYGVARRDGKFSVFRKEWVEVDGVFQWRVLAIKRGDVASDAQQRVFNVDKFAAKPQGAPTAPKKEEHSE